MMDIEPEPYEYRSETQLDGRRRSFLFLYKNIIFTSSTMAAAPAEPNGTSIEALFRPSTRFRDLYRHVRLPDGWTEIELLPGLSLEDVRATRLTWDAFHRCLHGKIVWMTPSVYVCHTYRPGARMPLFFSWSEWWYYQPACLCNAGYGCCTGDCDLRLSGSPLRNL
jgi:hypothetical protein